MSVHNLTEISLDFLLNNKHEVTEACLHGVIDRIINNNMACLVHRINLFQTAVAAAHSCGENNQLRIFHNFHSKFLLYLYYTPKKYFCKSYFFFEKSIEKGRRNVYNIFK